MSCAKPKGESTKHRGGDLLSPQVAKIQELHGICASPIPDTHSNHRERGELVTPVHPFAFLRAEKLMNTAYPELSFSSLLQQNCQGCAGLISSWRRLLW